MVSSSEKKSSGFGLPPADFSTLLVSLGTSVQLNLGLLQDPDSREEHSENLPQAQYTIDIIAMLQEKTQGNLTQEESELVQNLLSELRLAYVEKCKTKK